MSTRAVVIFRSGWDNRHQAMIYRHSDGYPGGLGEDIQTFLDELEQTVPDNRFYDYGYLAAKWVVWDCTRYVAQMNTGLRDCAPNCGYLDFLGCGIIQEEPGDIEYRYIVQCGDTDSTSSDSGARPKVTCQEV